MTLINHHCFESTLKITLSPTPSPRREKKTSFMILRHVAEAKGTCEVCVPMVEGVGVNLSSSF